MAYHNGPRIITDGLVFSLDAANSKSYSGSGLTASDLTITGAKGSLQNGLEFTNTSSGEFDFDGVDDQINFGNILNSVFSGASFTIDTWLKRTTQGFKVVFGKWNPTGNQRTMLLTFSGTTNRLVWDISSNGAGGGSGAFIVTTTEYLLNEWQNVVIVWDNSQAVINDEIKIYVNGVRGDLNLGNTTLSGNDTIFASGTGEFIMGMSPAQTAFIGKQSSCRVYNRNLSSTEVLQNYYAIRSRYGV